MSSTQPPGTGPVTVPALRDATARSTALVGFVAGALAEGGRLDLGSLPADVAAEVAVDLLRLADQATAAATTLVGHVTAVAGPATGTLIAGQYASPRRWLEVEAGLGASTAATVIARARDLREHSAPVAQAWLAGEVSGDSVRELTCGVSGFLKLLKTSRAEKDRLRAEAIDVLLPVASQGSVADTKRAVGKLRLLAESAHEKDRAVAAYDEQSLTCVQVGDLTRIEAWLTHEAGAAVLTVVDQYARRILDADPDVDHEPGCPLATPMQVGDDARRWCSCGAAAESGTRSNDRWDHLRAVAFADVMTRLLDDGAIGSHQGVAPHITVQVTLDELKAGLGAELTMPGSDDPVLISTAAARRIMCDASITPVIVQRLLALETATGTDHLAQLLRSTAIAVLFVGRSQRTATLAQRRALQARDRHCIFPGCRAHPRRCQAHHVVEWENSGSTDLDNLCLLCPRHHISVHEGGWTITRTPGTSPHETGCWTLAPPRPQP